MASSWREYQSILYLVLLALGVVLLIITVNDLIIKNFAVMDSGFSLIVLGAWEYWVFALGIILAGTFAYYFVKVTNDTKKFNELIKSSSKHSFLKNLRELQKISHSLGPKFETELHEVMNKWKVK